MLRESAHGQVDVYYKEARLMFMWSFINHSCEPNAEFVTREGLNGMVLSVIATRDIKVGEEVTIVFTAGGVMPYAERQLALRT